jgi:hypothetical protein
MALAVAGAGALGDLGLHQLLGQPAHGLPQHVGVLVGQHLADQLAHAHPATSVIAVLLSLEPKHRRFSKPAVADLPATLTSQ